MIQQYPHLYKNAWLIERIPQDDSARRFPATCTENDLLVEFQGKRCSFDALSFWVTGYGRERSRTFAGSFHKITRLLRRRRRGRSGRPLEALPIDIAYIKPFAP